ncbi:MAG TPA: gamma-glutamylcyclotransferase family protein [Pyrinomonadaceae bacterium]|nr:gamma-glutamylcyclotransferase family protein [Pyrinomonadaceae bacterium]
MHPNQKHHELLFTYGTLQTEAVQLATFGRKLDGTEDALIGYRLKIITIDDQYFIASTGTADHRNLEFTGDSADSVAGTVFKVTQSELEQADAYEPDGYKRVLVQLRSGVTAWAYMTCNRQTTAPLTKDPY